MISSFFFLLLIAFQLWHLASGQVKTQPVGYQLHVVNNPQPARIAGGVLAGLAAGLLVLKLGPMSGLCAWLVGLMGVGGLVVVLAPFRYLSTTAVVLLYALFVILEVAL